VIVGSRHPNFGRLHLGYIGTDLEINRMGYCSRRERGKGSCSWVTADLPLTPSIGKIVA